MSFGGQTPTIIVLKEGESYPTAAAACWHTKTIMHRTLQS